MYIPKPFSSDDAALARRIVAEHAFAVLMTPADTPEISHLPLRLIDDGSAHGLLIGHVAKANPHWQRFDGAMPAVAVFSGPHAYVSPNWYANEALVPTWNYAAVHMTGKPRAIEDEDRAADILRLLVAQFESDATGNWTVERLPEGHLARQIKGIVAFEMPVDAVEIKVKMSQNRKPEDIAGVIGALSESPREDDRTTAAMMRDLNS